MRDFTEDLNINREDAVNVADAYEGYARALRTKENNNDVLLVGSSFLISALYNSLFSPKKARELFALSADSFFQLQSPLWYLCEICAQNGIKYRSNRSLHEVKGEDREQIFYKILWEYNSEVNLHFSRHLDQDFVFTGWLPNLNIPYQLVIDTIDEMQRNSARGRGISFNYFSNLIVRLDELEDLHQIDEFRWKNVEGPILPFELAALAIMVILLKIWCGKRTYGELLNNLEKINAKQTVLVRIAYQLLDEDGKFRFE